MIKSMTGYGRAQVSLNGRDITVEIRSVNHRYFDCSIRTPRGYTFLEEAIKSKLQSSIARGKTDVFITIDTSKLDNVSVALNEPMLRGYLDIATNLRDIYGLRDDMTVTQIMHMPDVMTISKEQEDTDALTTDVLQALGEALIGYSEMSVKEGVRLAEDIYLRLDLIAELVNKIEVRSPKCVDEYREKLEVRMKEVLETVSIDSQRILTEAALFADKIAVTEEIVRLRSHVSQLRDMLNKGGAIGRKLDFLVQEFNREANTIGSKANDVEMAQLVVDLKAEIEKIREQVQNIE